MLSTVANRRFVQRFRQFLPIVQLYSEPGSPLSPGTPFQPKCWKSRASMPCGRFPQMGSVLVPMVNVWIVWVPVNDREVPVDMDMRLSRRISG